MDDRAYLGKGWAFPPEFIEGQGTGMVATEEDIRQSLAVLFSTSPGERIFRADYGCSLRRWVFTEMTLSEKTLIVDAIRQAVLFFEPRITVEAVDARVEDTAGGILWISLTYRVRQTNNRSNMVYPFYFREGTSL